MDWHEEAAQGLPARRDDEPSSLRDDIVDELSDHLQCAFGRELGKNILLEEAVQNVRRRFGDPRAIARRLWFDAMKEAIMARRWTVVLLLVLGFSSIAATAFACVSVLYSRAVARDMAERNAAALEKLTAAIATLRREPQPAAPPAPAQAKIKVRLVLDDPDKLPAIGYTALLEDTGPQPVQLGARSADSKGEFDFGDVPARPCRLHVLTPWGEGSEIPLDLVAGKTILETVACPVKPQERCGLSFRVGHSDLLKKAGIVLLCRFESDPSSRKISGREWTFAGVSDGGADLGLVGFDADGRTLFVGDPDGTRSAIGGKLRTRHFKVGPDLIEMVDGWSIGITWDQYFAVAANQPRTAPISVMPREYRLKEIAFAPRSAFKSTGDGDQARIPAIQCHWISGPSNSPFVFRAAAAKDNVWTIPVSEPVVQFMNESPARSSVGR